MARIASSEFPLNGPRCLTEKSSLSVCAPPG
jgi:hypothetical protein